MKQGLRIMVGIGFLILSTHIAVHSQVVETSPLAVGGLTTLYAHDPIGQSICFTDGKYGSVIQASAVRNRCSHLNFNSYTANWFRVGVQGGNYGVILDLGDDSDLQTKYGYSRIVGNGNGYASLSVRNGKVYILKDYQNSSLQETDVSSQLFQPKKDSDSVPIKLGHVYLIRLWDAHDKGFEMLAKLIVTSFTPNESVTFRWQILNNEKEPSY